MLLDIREEKSEIHFTFWVCKNGTGRSEVW